VTTTQMLRDFSLEIYDKQERKEWLREKKRGREEKAGEEKKKKKKWEKG
jgi:hypothetical protein